MKQVTATIILAVLTLLGSCAHLEYAQKQAGYHYLKRPFIRVRIYVGHNEVEVGGTGSFVVRAWPTAGAKSRYFSASPLRVKAVGDFLNFSDSHGAPLDCHLRKVTMIPQKKGEKLWINGKVFRGIFEFWPEKRGGFCVVNVLNVEDYLRGVLPPEIGKRNKDEFAALKAQAVAARTYALSTKDKYADKEYDLINDIRDQVYTGIAGETDQTDKAISKTRGEALTYWGELIQAYYHSTCSGQTENIEEVWEREPIPYLRSVKDADFCHWSKFYDWNELFDTAELLQNIRSYLAENNRPTGLVGDTLRDLKITAKTTTGRVRSVTVTTDKGSIILHKDQIRWAFGRAGTQGIMRSTNFTLDLERNGDGSVGKVHVTGYGYGHGVGMCQCGAIGMARAGFDYQAILKNYYTGVKIEKLY